MRALEDTGTKRQGGRNLAHDRFVRINRQRLRRLRECLLPRQCSFLDVLPLLFHTNHPLLPGYVSQSTPCGICDYQPSGPSIRATQRLSKSFTLERHMLRRLDIRGIYFMGSSGSIAHSTGSDLDVWLCHTPDLSPEQVDELQRKASGIEAWASTLNLEVHFFVFDADRFRGGEHQQLSGESSGSAQHYLLLDEFYRSGLIVAGLYPLWFLVPPEEEHHYADYIARLHRRGRGAEHDYIDFGGLAQLPAAEFFGAAVWQLYKSIDSPYKSVLKLLLMEVYASEHPNLDLLSLSYKKAVYAGETNLNELDPYLLMYRRVEEYLRAREDSMRLSLLRRCFYLKVDEKLSLPRVMKDTDWRRDLMESMVTAWGWDEQQIHRLDDRNNWKLLTVLDERRDLVSALTQSYRALSQFARQNSEISRISQTDLHVLGRKLYAAFERKAGKIELVNRGISPGLWEAEVSLHQLNGTALQEAWMLFRGLVPREAIGEHSPLKRGSGIMELLCWCYFNKLIDPSSHIIVYAQSSTVTIREVKATIQALEQLFPGAGLEEPRAEDLIEAPRLRTAALFVNVGIDPTRLAVVNGAHLASSRSNALSYGGLHKNLALAFNLVLASSWGEAFTFRYVGVRGLLDCICEYLRWASASKQVLPPPIQVFCFSSGYSLSIRTTLESLFVDILRCFYTERRASQARYVLEIENSHHVLAANDEALTHHELTSYAALLRYLAAPATRFCSTVIDRNSLGTTLLPVLFEHNESDTVQLFFKVMGQAAEVYVLDEQGTLFQQTVPYYDEEALIQHFMLFFESINRKRQILGLDMAPAPGIRFYALVKGREGKREPKEVSYAATTPVSHYFDIQVIVRLNEANEKVFTVYCDDREFSALELGSEIYKSVAAHVLEQRKSGNAYPIYITDIDLSRELLEQRDKNGLQTIYFLNYKKIIEDRLNQALGEL